MGTTIDALRPAVNAWSPDYLDEQYRLWQRDPSAVGPDLAEFFRGFDLGRASPAPPAAPLAGAPASAGQRAVDRLIDAYRRFGHRCATLDPFGRERPAPPELDPQTWGLSDADLDAEFDPGDLPVDRPATLRAILGALDETYCRSIGVEYMHIADAEARAWWRGACEPGRNTPRLSAGERVHALERLHRAEMFETFLHKRYLGQKRFSLEGAESLIPLLDRVLEQGAELGVGEFVMGMAHRGRLNVLNNILGKSYEQIFTEFEANWEEDFVDGGGDVKYHLGYSADRQTRTGKTVRVVLASNPSHLESVNGVVEGRTRAKQRLRGGSARSAVAPVLIHGDAAVIGQGVVQETLNLAGLEGYTTGGTVHIVINNLIGFTTGPEDSRTSEYCTDIFKMIDTPVIHVNGEDPDAVVLAADLAVRYRQEFGRDVAIDLWCYRRWGHNEGDDPSFTQPIMAALIKKKPSVLKIYAERLLDEGVIAEKDVQAIRRSLEEQLEKAQSHATEMAVDPTIDPGSWRWEGFTHRYSHDPVDTGVKRAVLAEVAEAIGRTPEGFHAHRTLAKILKKRASVVAEDAAVDWGTAEALAIGSLLVEGTAVRLTGQDSRRGTFSHRHAVLRDTQTAEPYVPLNHIRAQGVPGVEGEKPGDPGPDGKPRQARFCVYDSPLSEEVCVAYEYGYSLADPNMLVIWEAQFGDFVNGAQVIIDQYLASAEVKWQRWSGLTLLLPHAYEGQGPEHSSARLERFLTLCADDNMQVVYPTTPAQIFHLLRRQVRRKFRKPLIVMSPKSLLRLPACASSVQDLVKGRFVEILDDPVFEESGDRRRVTQIVLCTGKVFYDLDERRRDTGRDDLAIVRVEQLYPLNTALLETVLKRYPKSATVTWVQEEPKNAGAYRYFDGAVRDLLGWTPLPYIGRPASATPATGSKKQHEKEQDALLTEAVGAAAAAAVTT
ncbi:MAG: 2-oxoglutarate dehydrogenase E1 component [Planctomycetota bacterium]|nr:MAG: 2-oxoglutarate dehydrogenase E1 component [Planctomycetota bacterium]